METAKPNMKKYTATLTFVQYSRGEVLIKARSLKEARRKADEIGADGFSENASSAVALARRLLVA